MGKFVAGCLIVLVVVVVGGGGVAYFMFLKPGMDFAGDVVRFGQEFQEINEGLEDRSRFQPPSSGALDEDRFQRFLGAQGQMRERLSARLSELEAKYETIQADLDAADAEPSMRQMANAYRDLGDLLLEAKRAQVEAINDHDFSLEEYTWTRNQVYRAIGQQVAVAGVGEEGNAGAGSSVDADTVALVEPHTEELMETHVLAWWGL